MSTEQGSASETGSAATAFGGASGTPVTPTGDTNGTGADQGALSADQVLDAGLKDDPDIADWVKKSGVKSVADLARNARHNLSQFHKMQGLAEGVPGADADAERLNKFYDTVGRPPEPSGYEFKLPEDTPEDFPYDSDAADSFKQAAHANGLRPEQAAGLHDWFVKTQADLFTETQAGAVEQSEEAQKAQAKTLSDATKTLEEVFDAPSGSNRFNSNLEYAQRFFRENGNEALTEEMLKIGALVEGPDGSNQIAAPRLFAAIANAGRALYAEGGQGPAGNGLGSLNHANPWKKETWNVTLQHQIQANDAPWAARLKAAAGVK